MNHKNLYRSVEPADLTTSNEYKQVPVLTATCKYPQVGLYCIYVGLNIQWLLFIVQNVCQVNLDNAFKTDTVRKFKGCHIQNLYYTFWYLTVSDNRAADTDLCIPVHGP